MSKKREHHCDLRLKKRGSDVNVVIDCRCKAFVVAKVECLPDVDAADVTKFAHNPAAHRCPGIRLALARVGMDEFMESCETHRAKKRGRS